MNITITDPLHPTKQIPTKELFDKDTVFEGSYVNFINKVKERGICEINDIIELINIMQINEMDVHIGIVGQNGVGKSHTELLLCKKLNKDKMFDNLFLADKTTDDIIQFLLHNENTTLCIDEMNIYLQYKDHASSEQNHLITAFEHARSKCIAVIGCIRDPRKLTLNYRDGKLSIIIWMLDRFKDKSGSYAAVLVGNPMLEGDDRFGIKWLDISTPDFEDMRSQFENLPSFIGYMYIPSSYLVLKEEIEKYKKMKDVAMAYAHMNRCIKKFKKKTITEEEFMEQLNQLKDIFDKAGMNGADIINQKTKSLFNKTKQSSMDDFIEE